jgi:hypothetical protein
MTQRCLARAYGDMPVDRRVVGRGHGLIYIVSPAIQGSEVEVANQSIGFPEEAVFEFDAALYQKLVTLYEQKNRAELAGLWSKAKPFQQPTPDIDIVASENRTA